MLRLPPRLAALVATGMLVCSAAPSARADDPAPSSRADTLFWEGRRAADAGDLVTACARFAESLALERLAGTAFNLAHCEDQRGLLASAWRHYEEAARRMKPDDKRLAVARKRAAALEPRLPRLTVQVRGPHPPGLAVTCDGEPLPAVEFGAALPVDPGDHLLRVTADGREPREVRVTVAAAETKEIELDPGPAAVPSQAPAAAPPPRPSEPVSLGRGPAEQRIAGWAFLGAGGAGLVLGAVASGMVLHEKALFDEQCPGAVCRDRTGIDTANRGRTWGLTSDAAFAAGAAAAAVGLVLILYPILSPAKAGAPKADRRPGAPAAFTW